MSQQDPPEAVYVKDSTIHGRGLFAGKDLFEGQFIGYYEGTVVSEDGVYVLWLQEEGETWTGYEGNNHMRFLNHADQPNAEMDGLECYALRNIPAGEEITIDYGWNET